MITNEFTTVDTHIHLYRTAQEGWQARTIEDRWDVGGDHRMLLRYMDELGVGGGWILNAWPTKAMLQAYAARFPEGADLATLDDLVLEEMRERCARKNDFLCSFAAENPGRFAPMIAAVDPYFGTDWIVSEIERCHALGARGVKMISSWGGYYPWDPALWPAYEKLQELGMVILSHAGGVDSHGHIEGDDFAHPTQWLRVLDAFPNLKLVLAHLGYLQPLVGYGRDIQGQRHQLSDAYPNVYFDLSCSLEQGMTEALVRMIREVGVDRCLWASDWHTHRAAMSLSSLLRSPFNDEEKQMMLADNALTLIPLEGVSRR